MFQFSVAKLFGAVACATWRASPTLFWSSVAATVGALGICGPSQSRRKAYCGVLAIGCAAISGLIGAAAVGQYVHPMWLLWGGVVGGVAFVMMVCRDAMAEPGPAASVEHRGDPKPAACLEKKPRDRPDYYHLAGLSLIGGPGVALGMYAIGAWFERPNRLDVAHEVTSFLMIGTIIGLLLAIPCAIAGVLAQGTTLNQNNLPTHDITPESSTQDSSPTR